MSFFSAVYLISSRCASLYRVRRCAPRGCTAPWYGMMMTPILVRAPATHSIWSIWAVWCRCWRANVPPRSGRSLSSSIRRLMVSPESRASPSAFSSTSIYVSLLDRQLAVLPIRCRGEELLGLQSVDHDGQQRTYRFLRQRFRGALTLRLASYSTQALCACQAAQSEWRSCLSRRQWKCWSRQSRWVGLCGYVARGKTDVKWFL